MIDFDKAVEIALRTWYPEDHPLYMNPHHPSGKLLGEWGELLDDYMKSIYKPGYTFDPEDELGDIWYYVRILCYQSDFLTYFKGKLPDHENINSTGRIDYVIAVAMQDASINLIEFIAEKKRVFEPYKLYSQFLALFVIAKHYNLTLDDLTHSNWQKLKPGSERGEQWMKARKK